MFNNKILLIGGSFIIIEVKSFEAHVNYSSLPLSRPLLIRLYMMKVNTRYLYQILRTLGEA